MHRPAERTEFFLSAQGVTTCTIQHIANENKMYTRIVWEDNNKHKTIRPLHHVAIHYIYNLFPNTTKNGVYIFVSFFLYPLAIHCRKVHLLDNLSTKLHSFLAPPHHLRKDLKKTWGENYKYSSQYVRPPKGRARPTRSKEDNIRLNNMNNM